MYMRYNNMEEVIMHALCWIDPYAILSVSNTSFYSTTACRLIYEAFFDQQMQAYFHSFDILSFVLILVFMQVKLHFSKQK
jgi:hypothetical protein